MNDVDSQTVTDNAVDPRDATPWPVRFQRQLDNMTDAERRAGTYFLENPDAAYMSITEVVEASGVGYGSVIRFCKKLGCSGFQEFKVLLAAEMAAGDAEARLNGDKWTSSVHGRLRIDLDQTLRLLDDRSVEQAAQALCGADRVLIIGVASSAPLVTSLDWKLKRAGMRSTGICEGYVMLVDAAVLSRGDVLFAISSSGATKDILRAAEIAAERGATVIALTNFAKAPLVEKANIRLFTSASRDPFKAEIPSIIPAEAVLEALLDKILDHRPETKQFILDTFHHISDRKL